MEGSRALFAALLSHFLSLFLSSNKLECLFIDARYADKYAAPLVSLGELDK